ncbi:hypothetical protein P9112_002389 [Eukaryota sp. TZLM1-RC]
MTVSSWCAPAGTLVYLGTDSQSTLWSLTPTSKKRTNNEARVACVVENFHATHIKRSKTMPQKGTRPRRPEMPPSKQQRPSQKANPSFVVMDPNHSNLVGWSAGSAFELRYCHITQASHDISLSVDPTDSNSYSVQDYQYLIAMTAESVDVAQPTETVA